MAGKQKKYDKEYKIQAVKLSKEIGGAKAAAELGIPVDTLYGWQRAVREGRLEAGAGKRAPQESMALAEEVTALRKQVREQEKEIRRLKEENEFLEEASAFSPPAVGSQQRAENEVYRSEDGRRRGQGETIAVLPDTGGQPAGVLQVSGQPGPAVEIPGSGRGDAGNFGGGCVQRHLWAQAYISGAAAPAAGWGTYPQRTDDLPGHGGNRHQPTPQTQAQRYHQSGSGGSEVRRPAETGLQRR